MPPSLSCMGVYYISSKDSIETIISNWKTYSNDFATFSNYGSSSTRFRICLSSYYNVWESNDIPMYFSLPLIEWGKKALIDFNNKFNNIKIEILSERYIYYGTIVKESAYGSNTVTTYFHDEKLFDPKKHKKIYLPLFTVKYNDNYSDLSKYLIPMMVSMYVRLFAVNDYYTHFEDKEPEDFLQYACEHNDKYFSEYSVHVFHEKNGSNFSTLLPEHILWFDDIELMDKAFKSKTKGKYHDYDSSISIGTHILQTAVVNRLYAVANGDSKPEEETVVEKVVEKKIVARAKEPRVIPQEEKIIFDENEFLRRVKELENK